VFDTADWHEREAYDLVGIQYEGHPDPRRILLPDTWQGHPLSMDYDQDRPQIVTLKEWANPLEGDKRSDEGDTMYLNIGPHHPATHGVLHVRTVLDGEQVADVDPDIGYLHRCEEQMCQTKTYRHQIMPYPDRWDYGSSGLLNEWAYARAAEDLNDIDVPEYAQIIRTMGAELCRIASHMLALGTFALDIYGDFTAIFMYAMRDREIIQNILEDLTGQRMMFNYFRLGGVVWDLPEPREEFFEKIRDFLDDLPEALEEYHDMITSNEILQVRTIDTGVLPPEVAKSYGATGPVARGSGIDYDLRRDDSYGYYDELDWDVVTEDGCDNFSRLLVRMREVEESAKIIQQCVDLLEDWPEDERTIQSNVPRTLRPEDDTEIYRAVEGAKGELGIYIRADGTDKPGRFKIRSPCFSNLQTLGEMSNGEYIPDLIASLGSLDIILGEVDR
jgi:NADH-quinone oxidoreductase subunit C/D